MAADKQGGEVVPMHKYAAKTSEARERQRQNLKPRASVTHGAYSADKLAPERERVLGELVASFPSVRRDRLEIAASQRARITLLSAYCDAVGVIRHRARGTTYPAVQLLQREESAYRVELTRIEELHSAAGNTDPHAALAAITAELSEDGEQ